MDSPDSDKLPASQSKLYSFMSVSPRTLSTGSCISCTVYNYSDLPKFVYHCLTRTLSEKKFTFKFYKTLNHHFFHLHCDLEDTMTFHVRYDETELSKPISTLSTEYGYWVKVPKDVVQDPRNKYWAEKNSLGVQFHYLFKSPVVRNAFTLCGKKTRQDEEQFSRDMLKLFEMREKTSDFSIIVGEKRFLIHKFVFAARTTWFKENPKSWNLKQILIEGEPCAMSLVVRYMYIGVIQLNDCEIPSVLKIASILGMRSLIATIDATSKTATTEDYALKLANEMELLNVKNVSKMHLPDGECTSVKKSV